MLGGFFFGEGAEDGSCGCILNDTTASHDLLRKPCKAVIQNVKTGRHRSYRPALNRDMLYLSWGKRVSLPRWESIL